MDHGKGWPVVRSQDLEVHGSEMGKRKKKQKRKIVHAQKRGFTKGGHPNLSFKKKKRMILKGEKRKGIRPGNASRWKHVSGKGEKGSISFPKKSTP